MNKTGVKCHSRIWSLGLKTSLADLSTAKFVFFYGKTFEQNQAFPLDDAKSLIKHPNFDMDRETVIYIHGYVESMEVESIHVIAEAYMKRGDHNILILDWAALADGNYVIDAVPSAKQLGPKIADVLIDLFMEGLRVDKLHIVGHSLGGQMAGMIGRSVISKTKGGVKLKRLTALDPAFPLFYPPVGTRHISARDATFVDIIHTDAWLYGSPASTGTADFWPNGGNTLQPGCPKRNYKMLTDNDLCSHRRSWRFWAESVTEKNRPSFHAVKSKSWKNFKRGAVDETPIGQMGIDCKPTLKGDFYLQTNGDVPYSKGIHGTAYHKASATL